MTIDSYNIESVLKLKLLKVEGNLNLPRRKSILREPGVAAGDIVFDEDRIQVFLYGKFATTALVGATADALKTILQTAQVHTFVIPEHDISVTGVVKEGFKTEIRRKIIRISFTIHVTE